MELPNDAFIGIVAKLYYQKDPDKRLESVPTKSHVRASRSALDDTWEIKIYTDAKGKHYLCVGKRTETLSHAIDALKWFAGISPNANNAEKYGKFTTTDEKSLEDYKLHCGKEFKEEKEKE